MNIMSYSIFRTHLASTLDKVSNDHNPVLITRQNGKSAVLMSLEDFQAYEETAYLLANPKNAARLHQSMREAEAGRKQIHDLVEE